MFRIVHVPAHARVAHLRDGRFVGLLGPGRHTLSTLSGRHELLTLDVRELTLPVRPGDALPAELDGTRLVSISPTQVGVVTVDGRPDRVVPAGRHRLWVDTGPDVQVTVHDAWADPAALDDADQLPAGFGGQVEHVVDGATLAVLMRAGRPVRVLAPGRYRLWTAGPWSLLRLNAGAQALDVAVQDLVSQDMVPVRVKPAASLVIEDPLRWVGAGAPLDLVYTAVQLGLREVVADRPLEILLAQREALSAELRDRARAHLPDLGVALAAVALKDVILPGEVREQFNKVTVARKEAEAQAIRRREEVAQTRQLANTAKLLADNPTLMRLRELEHLAELASKVDQLTVVGGEDIVRNLLTARAAG